MKAIFRILFLCLAYQWASTLRAGPGEQMATSLNLDAAKLRAPEFARWVVTSENSVTGADKNEDGEEKEVSAPLVETVTKTGTWYHHESENVHGGKTAKWCIGNIQITIRPEWKEPLVSSNENQRDPSYVDYSTSDFPEFKWVSRHNCVGIEEVADHVCLVFKDKIDISTNVGRHWAEERDPTAEAATAQWTQVEGYLDYYSHLPVKLVLGDEKRSYRFEKPPLTKLSLPAEIQRVLDTWEQQRKELLRPPARP